MERGLTLQVVIRVSRAGKGVSVAVGSGLPRVFADPDSARAFIGGLGADLRDFDAWAGPRSPAPGSSDSF